MNNNITIAQRTAQRIDRSISIRPAYYEFPYTTARTICATEDGISIKSTGDSQPSVTYKFNDDSTITIHKSNYSLIKE